MRFATLSALKDLLSLLSICIHHGSHTADRGRPAVYRRDVAGKVLDRFSAVARR